MNNKLLIIAALLLSSTLSAAENKQATCNEITDEMKLAIAAMCSLEPSPLACESEAIKLLQQDATCKAGE